MINEAIILAGGFGTRLRSVVSDLPKCMAPVDGVPFLEYVIHYACAQGIEKIVFAVGYKKESIREYFAYKRLSIEIVYSEEIEPLGTGGAIAQALQYCTSEQVLVLNGDTFVEYNVKALLKAALANSTATVLAVKELQQFDRYGSLILNENDRIVAFEEKKYKEKGIINLGVYLINRNYFNNIDFPTVFSFEKDYLEKYFATENIFGVLHDGYFIDIGIPEDYEKAQLELPQFLQ